MECSVLTDSVEFGCDLMQYSFLVYVFSIQLIHSIQEPRATHRKGLLGKIVVKDGKEGVRSAQYEDMSDRYQFILDLTRPRL